MLKRFLSLFTELPMDEVRRLGALEGAEINAAKIVLADEATQLCHSVAAADRAKATAATTFDEKGMGDGLPQFGGDRRGTWKDGYHRCVDHCRFCQVKR